MIEIFLSTIVAWMKNWPQGVIVVPIAAITVSTQMLVGVTLGTTVLWAAACQSGWARKPATM